MRKIFAVATSLALVGATLFGAVWAWSAQDTDSSSATVGTVAVTATISTNSAVLGPNNDLPVIVGSVAVANTGSLDATSFTGTVTIDAVNSGPPSSSPVCAVGHFSGGSVSGSVPGSDDIEITTLGTAPDDCQGDTVDYTVSITAQT